MPHVVHPDPDCETCRAFVDGVETLPMFDELRGRVMIQALRDGGWPPFTLRRVVELVVDVGL